MILRLVILLLIIPLLSVHAQSEIEPNKYIAFQASQEILIDGRDDDEDWDKVAWSEEYIDIEGVQIPKYKTRMKMLWDREYLYILAKMEEPHVWGDITKRDTIVFYNNDFEVFVDPDGDTHNYYELETNSLNTPWDIFLTKPYRDKGNAVINDWDVIGLKSAVYVDGTINDPSDIDKAWYLEMAIPWSTFKTSFFQDVVPVDRFWRMDFSRVNWQHEINDGKYSRKKAANGKFLPEYNWVWSPTGVINMHEPEKWGYVYFSSKKAGMKDSFEIPEDDRLKWALYKIHRAQLAFYNDNDRYLDSLETLSSSIVINDVSIDLTLENYSDGYVLSAKSPFTGKTLIVKSDGKFISK